MIVKVRIDPAHYDETTKYLRDEVVPMTKEAPGFVKGTWVGDTEAGYAFVIFETDAHAQAVAATVTSGPDAPVQIESVEVFEVNAEA